MVKAKAESAIWFGIGVAAAATAGLGFGVTETVCEAIKAVIAAAAASLEGSKSSCPTAIVLRRKSPDQRFRIFMASLQALNVSPFLSQMPMSVSPF